MAANVSGNPGKTDLQALQALLQAGRVVEAEAGYRECLRGGDVRAAGPLSTLLLQQERDREVAELLEPLVRAAPDNGEWIVSLSIAWRRVGRLDEALQHARRGVALLPQALPAWNALGVAAMESGRLEEALGAFDSGLKAVPGHPALALHRAMTLRQLGRNVEALPAFTQLARSFPQVPEGWRGLADVQEALGQIEAALHSRERARALVPNDPHVAFELALTMLQAGRASEAARVLESLLQAAGDHPQAWLMLARARSKLDDVAEARTALEHAKALAPEDPQIAHYHAALTGVLPAAVESDYIRNLFDDFADRFEHTLVDQLRYDTPVQLARLLQRLGADAAGSVLDLGCGTGLMAQQLARPGRVIDGVDLSPRMLERAREKALYRDLQARELNEFLTETRATWDLVVAADVYIYVPDPGASFPLTFARMAPGGWFAFSIERSGGDDSELMLETGRYRQSPARVVRELVESGFVDITQEDIVLRLESGQPVAGVLVVARRPL
jgi:predicted TPR repeat methyltransferase